MLEVLEIENEIEFDIVSCAKLFFFLHRACSKECYSDSYVGRTLGYYQSRIICCNARCRYTGNDTVRCNLRHADWWSEVRFFYNCVYEIIFISSLKFLKRVWNRAFIFYIYVLILERMRWREFRNSCGERTWNRRWVSYVQQGKKLVYFEKRLQESNSLSWNSSYRSDVDAVHCLFWESVSHQLSPVVTRYDEQEILTFLLSCLNEVHEKRCYFNARYSKKKLI